VYQPGEGGPRIDPSGRAIAKLIELTEVDFPDHDLIIAPDGALSIAADDALRIAADDSVKME